MSKNKIYKDIAETMEKHNVKLPASLTSPYADYSNGDSTFGGVNVHVDMDIDISHIENFHEALQKLTDYDDSPIADDGYTATDIHNPYGTDVIYYNIDYDYVFKEYREVSINILKENCDHKMVDDIIEKIDKLYKLGFDSITLSYSSYIQEQFEKRVKEEENEITAGYYELEDADLTEVKYKVAGINIE